MQTGQEVLGKLNGLKGNIQGLWDKFSHSTMKLRTKLNDEMKSSNDEQEFDSDRNITDDLPLTLNRDAGPGVKFYDTENSEVANGAEKVIAHGIDSFGEESTFDPDEADEHQTYRDRKQNSDLSERFYTPGLDLNKPTNH